MLRTTIFSLVTFLFALTDALPTVSGATNSIQQRSPKKKGYKKHPPKYQPNPPANCPTGTYNLQTSYDSTYARLQLNTGVAADAFLIAFDQTSALTAAPFNFIQSDNGQCQLSILPTDGITFVVGFQSAVFDNPGAFSDPHAVFIKGPGPLVGTYDQTAVYCNADASLTLTCTVTNGAQTQNVLFEQDIYLSIGTAVSGFGSVAATITLVPAL